MYFIAAFSDNPAFSLAGISGVCRVFEGALSESRVRIDVIRDWLQEAIDDTSNGRQDNNQANFESSSFIAGEGRIGSIL